MLERMMKNRTGFLAAALLAAAGCSGPQTGGESLRVALVFDIGGRGDGGFNDLAYQGLDKAVRELGVRPILHEPKRNLERELALNEVAASDADLIIGVGFSFADRLSALAAQHPEKKFVCIDYASKTGPDGRTIPPPANLAGLGFKEEEGSYLVGMIAALKSRTGKIGFVGGMDGPVIRKFEAGYVAGAESVRTGIIVLSKFAGLSARAFNDPAKGYELADRMFKEGADVIYQAAGATGAGVFQAARESGFWVIGVDVDQFDQAPGRVLTSMVKHVEVTVFESIKSCVEKRFSGGEKTFGLKENGVGFVCDDRNREWIGPDAVKAARKAEEKIVAGKAVVPAAAQARARIEEGLLLDILSRLQEEIAAVLETLNGDLARSARSLSGLDPAGEEARGVLRDLYGSHPYIIDCETVNDRGIMTAVEPPALRSSEGADISAQAHMIKLFKTHQPVLSGSFRSVEGPEAVAFHHPVFSPDMRFAGSVSALFAPEYVLAGVVGPVSSNLPVDIFLMQADGLVIFDADPKQIGLNVFTDPMYEPFPELRELAKSVAGAKEGTGTYRFFEKGIGPATAETAYWRTVAVTGTEWRLVITCATDSLVK